MIVGTVKIDKADFKENKIYFIMREVLTYGKKHINPKCLCTK